MGLLASFPLILIATVLIGGDHREELLDSACQALGFFMTHEIERGLDVAFSGDPFEQCESVLKFFPRLPERATGEVVPPKRADVIPSSIESQCQLASRTQEVDGRAQFFLRIQEAIGRSHGGELSASSQGKQGKTPPWRGGPFSV